MANFEIYVMEANGSNQIKLTNNPGADRWPGWSPDGTKIAFYSFRDGNYEIYVMDANGSNPTNLTNHPAQDDAPRWSPDGRRIIFTSLRFGNPEILVMNSDGTEPLRVTHMFGTSSAGTPDWQRIPVALEMTFTPSSVIGGQSTSLTATLSAVVPAGGVEIKMTCDDPRLELPSSIFVPAGARSVTVPLATKSTRAAASASVTAILGTASVSATLNILPGNQP